LLRPDSYVALADSAAAPAVLERYFSDHGIQLTVPITADQPSSPIG
jgi:hypothetical protein